MTAVLFTCAGQRVDIVTAFKRAGARTIAADVNRLAPALYHADSHAFVPRIDDPEYVPTLRALALEHDVKLIVPLTDLDHGVLSRAKDELGALVLLPEPSVVDALADKWLAHLLFEERGIGSPPTWLPADLPRDVEFPVLVKARKGFGSRGIYRCEDARELEFFLDYVPEPVIQTFLDGPEYTIDVLCDFSGEPLAVVPRERVIVRAGVVDRGRTVRDQRLIDLGVACARALKFYGAVNIQCRIVNDRPVVFEINPRFSGGIPLTIAAGADFPAFLLDLTAGRSVPTRIGHFRGDLWLTSYEASIFVEAEALESGRRPPALMGDVA